MNRVSPCNKLNKIVLIMLILKRPFHFKRFILVLNKPLTNFNQRKVYLLHLFFLNIVPYWPFSMALNVYHSGYQSQLIKLLLNLYSYRSVLEHPVGSSSSDSSNHYYYWHY